MTMTRKQLTGRYYHAGAAIGERIKWSNHTRRSARAAEREARSLARKCGGVGLVESWDMMHGLRPGDCEVVDDSWWVDED